MPKGRDTHMRLKHPLYLIISISLPFFLSTSAKARTHANFWAPLTAFEIKVLNNIDAARSGNADALLALALVTSGDIRHQQSFATIKKQVRQFINRYQASIDGQLSVYAQGEKLLGAMHDTYFNHGQTKRNSDLVDGYDAEQSKVSEIFQSGRFNCVSSAILYIILARYFGIAVQGVVTTQHAFVQINMPNGRTVEVETTSKNGYGQTHDKSFYDKHFAAFSRSRNLEMPTYEDYLNRKVLSPFMLIVNNMNNQHTHVTRMDKTTRNRLFEIQGYLDNNTAASQINRLGVYQNSMIELLHVRNSSKTKALIGIIEPVVARIKTRPWINDTRNRDVKVIWERLDAIHTLWGHLLLADKQYAIAEYQYAEALQWARSTSRQTKAQKGIYKAQAFKAFKARKWQQAIGAYKKLLVHLKPSEKNLILQTRNNIVAAYWNWGSAAEGQSNWMAAAKHYSAIAEWTENNDTLKKAQAAKVNARAMDHFKNRRWAEAVRQFKAAMAIQEPKADELTHHSIGSAYINWGNDLFYDKKYLLALEKYEAAVSVSKTDRKKAIYQNVIAVYRSLTAHLLKEKKYNAAVTLIQPSAERFPNCTPCQREIDRLNRLTKTHRKP